MNEFDFEKLELKWLEIKRMSVKYSTYLKYENVITSQINPYFKGYKLEDFNDNTIFHFFDLKKKILSENYLKIIKYILSSIIQLGKESYDFPLMHIDKIKFTNKKRTTIVLTEKQKNQLLEYCKNNKNPLSTAILISLYGGLRIGEICGLQWNNIDFENSLIYINKTAQRQKIENNSFRKTKLVLTEPKTTTSKRYVPIPQFLNQYLQSYKDTYDNNDFVLSNKSSIYDPRNIQKRFKILCKNNNFETNFHNLRHSYATECVYENVEIKSLSEILGHANVSTTLNLYVHSSMEYKKKQIEKLKTPQWS